MIHEVAHLCGLEGEDESDENSLSLQNAEALANFCLCVCEKLTLEEIILQKEQNRDKITDETSKELTKEYDPTQPRVPKGSPDGGKWTKEGSSDTDSSSDNDRKNSKKGKTSKNTEKGIKNDIFIHVSEEMLKNAPRIDAKCIGLEGFSPAGAISGNTFFEKIDEGRKLTGKCVDFISTFSDNQNGNGPMGESINNGIWNGFCLHLIKNKPNSDVTVLVKLSFNLEYENDDESTEWRKKIS